MRRTIALFTALLVLLPATTASARVAIRVGIGDQNIGIFDQSAFQRAKFKRVRYILPWNVMDSASQRLSARAYIQRARASGMTVLVHVSTDDYRIKKAHLPSVSAYH